MTVEPAENRREQWVLVVRQSFEIPDTIVIEDARRVLVERLEERLQENGWHSAPRAIAEPMTDALLELGANGDLDDWVLSVEASESAKTCTTQDAAHRLIDRGLTVVDPEHLAFDVMMAYPDEVVATLEEILERISQYLRERPYGD